MSPPAALLCTALLAGFWAIERKAFLQAMLSRPVVVGTCLGLVWGMPWLGLAIGSVVELFFLGAVNIGASLPGNELWACLTALSFAAGLSTSSGDVGAPLTGPATLVLALAVGMPMSLVGRHFDEVQECLNVRIGERAAADLMHGKLDTAVRLGIVGFRLSATLAVAASLLFWGVGWGAGKLVASLDLALSLSAQTLAALERGFGFAALGMGLAATAVALATLNDARRSLLIALLAALICLALWSVLNLNVAGSGQGSAP
ncbi:MAG: PTS sugar transporter subunit IIC [Myxococcales bacterium]|jgi:PTS system mannose-specific IIC component|nr:PTS sugar transporter subunit IIC [Myxococcales bacterium]